MDGLSSAGHFEPRRAPVGKSLEAGKRSDLQMIVVGALTMEPEKYLCQWRGISICLTRSQFPIVAAMARRPGVTWDRERLSNMVTRGDRSTSERAVDTHIRRARRKFEAVDPTFEQIKTVHTVGYQWRPR
jgi:DNA-binding response OmpR family regulator